MKKFIVLSLAVMVVMGMFGFAMAEGMYTRDPSFTIKSAVESGSLLGLSTNVVAGNKIIGFSFTDSAAGSCGLYDAATAAATSNFGEAYVAAGGVANVIFPFPYKVVRGLAYGLSSASTSKLTVWYE